MGLTIDDVMEKIGSFGRYQFRLLWIMGFMKIFGDGFQVMITTFLSAEPPWKCKENSSVCNLTGIFSPGHDNYSYRCGIPREDWEFDLREFNSIVSEWDLVCDVSALSSLTKSLVFLGYLIGVLGGGVISDKIGRRILVYIPSILGNVSGLIVAFVHSYWIYVLLRILVGICVGSSSLSMYILLTEYVGKRHRHVAGTCLWFFWVFSLMLLALFAYLIRDWRTLAIAGAVPGLLQVFFWWYLPESIRWLLVHNKQQQALDQLTKVASFNRKEMPQESIEMKVNVKRHGDVRDMFSSVTMTTRTLVSCFSWMVVSLVYYGVSFSSGTFGGNRYLVFFLTSIIELPSNYVAIVTMKRFGRKKILIVGLVASTIASAIAVLFQGDLSNQGFLVGNIIMAQVIAKFFINMAFCAVYVYSFELFPTVIRNLGVGSSSACARIGSMTAPYVVWLVRVHVLLPYSILVGFSFIASVLCAFLLPETKDAYTPETLDSVSSKGTGSNGSEIVESGSESVGYVCQEKKEMGEMLLKSYLA